VLFDARFIGATAVWLTSGSGSALTTSIGPDVEADPAVMPTAQQTETIPTAAVTAATR
jgi:hypothetical protein